MNFIFTVDAESDNAWEHPEIISLSNFSAIKKFQQLCEKYKIIPVYLLTYEYLDNKEAAEFFNDKNNLRKCELGLHFHSWSTPPFNGNKYDQNTLSAFQYELKTDVFLEKMENLYQKFVEVLDEKPIVYRAGRWAVDQRTIDWLIDKDFRFDSSIVPFYNFANSRGLFSDGPDFSSVISLEPFKIRHSINKDKYIIEIPLSVNIGNPILSRLYYLFNKDVKYKKILGKTGYRNMFRPYPKYPVFYYKNFLENLIRNNVSIINMMMHSSELILGGSPSTISQRQVDKTWRILDSILKKVDEKQIDCLGLKNYNLDEKNINFMELTLR